MLTTLQPNPGRFDEKNPSIFWADEPRVINTKKRNPERLERIRCEAGAPWEEGTFVGVWRNAGGTRRGDIEGVHRAVVSTIAAGSSGGERILAGRCEVGMGENVNSSPNSPSAEA